MAFKPGNTGRPKGAKGKFSSLKEDFLGAYQDIGGRKALAAWAKKPENTWAFYQMAAKMLPKEVEIAGPNGGPVEMKIKWEE
jgi:hypothetical protein